MVTIQYSRESRLLLDGLAGSIEVLITGIQHPCALALLCHPHPLHGGNMDNKVVFTMARACRDRNVLAVRFNFRGVGSSEGVHDGGRGELDDAAWLLQRLEADLPAIPLILGGFSFGAAIAVRLAQHVQCAGLLLAAPPVPRYGLDAIDNVHAPVLLLQGDNDEIVDSDEVYTWFGRLSAPQKKLKRWVNGGHFFHGLLPEVKIEVENFLSGLAI